MAYGVYPRTYDAVRGLVRKWALHTKNARDIARRAGLRQGTSPDIEGTGRAVTLIDCFVLLEDEALWVDEAYGGAYQWTVDLSPFTKMRVSSTWQNDAYLVMAPADSTDYAFLGNWSFIEGIKDTPPFKGDLFFVAGTWFNLGFSGLPTEPQDIRWITLPEAARQEVRVSIHSGGNFSGDSEDNADRPSHLFDSGPFAFSVQAM